MTADVRCAKRTAASRSRRSVACMGCRVAPRGALATGRAVPPRCGGWVPGLPAVAPDAWSSAATSSGASSSVLVRSIVDHFVTFDFISLRA
jgi:hypothetical protein